MTDPPAVRRFAEDSGRGQADFGRERATYGRKLSPQQLCGDRGPRRICVDAVHFNAGQTTRDSGLNERTDDCARAGEHDRQVWHVVTEQCRRVARVDDVR